MKIKILILIHVYFCFQALADSGLPIIVRDWAVHAGNNTDSIFHNPIVHDNDFTYVGTFTVNNLSGADILICKYNKEGQMLWSKSWTGASIGRDQPTAMIVDSLYIYLAGISFTDSINNIDFLTMKIKKEDGDILWVKKYNGSASTYDAATAITINDSCVFVSGIGNQSTLDYTTICYSKSSGMQQWIKTYDRNGLLDIPFAIAFYNDTGLVVTGGSQNSISDWDFVTIYYSSDGDALDTISVSGTGAGFDRAMAVRSNDSGSVYITGASFNNLTSYDIKTVKINPNGSLGWQRSYDGANDTDQGNDLLVDESNNVYVSASVQRSNLDGIIIKYKSNGSIDWTAKTDKGKDDELVKMCFDSDGNIIAVGKTNNGINNDYNFLVVAFSRDGRQLWEEYFDGSDHGDDFATEVVADLNGNIYVTGQALISDKLQTITLKFRSDYYLNPATSDNPSPFGLFYVNLGQKVDENNNEITDSVHYYTAYNCKLP